MKYLSICMSPRVLMTLRRSRPRGIVVSVRPLEVPRRHVAGDDARGPVRGEGRGHGRGGLLPGAGRAVPPDPRGGDVRGPRVEPEPGGDALRQGRGPLPAGDVLLVR